MLTPKDEKWVLVEMQQGLGTYLPRYSQLQPVKVHRQDKGLGLTCPFDKLTHRPERPMYVNVRVRGEFGGNSLVKSSFICP